VYKIIVSFYRITLSCTLILLMYYRVSFRCITDIKDEYFFDSIHNIEETSNILLGKHMFKTILFHNDLYCNRTMKNFNKTSFWEVLFEEDGNLKDNSHSMLQCVEGKYEQYLVRKIYNVGYFLGCLRSWVSRRCNASSWCTLCSCIRNSLPILILMIVLRIQEWWLCEICKRRCTI